MVVAPTARVVVVTGASSGIGLVTARELARRGDHVVLIGRDPNRLAWAAETVRDSGVVVRPPTVLRADFAVLDQVRAVAARLRSMYDRIDVLINNAGLLAPGNVTTVDGHELTMQVNYLAAFLLTHLLMERLPPGARVIMTTSALARLGRLDPVTLRDNRWHFSRWGAYCSSKQAVTLFTREAAARWREHGVVPTCLHPGAVRTGFARGSAFRLAMGLPGFVTPEEGADTLVWLATDDAGLATPGAYYVRRQQRIPPRRARDPQLAAQLWESSLTAVGLA